MQALESMSRVLHLNPLQFQNNWTRNQPATAYSEILDSSVTNAG